MTQDLQTAFDRISGPRTADVAGQEFAELVGQGIGNLVEEHAKVAGVDVPGSSREI